jgi:type III pantothenate kinase
LRRWCVMHWQREPWFLRSGDGTLGIINGYVEPEKLGSDRIAALLGARSLRQGDVVVVDCGTAVTVDWLDREEHFRGGVIFPGLSLLNGVLRERTAKVSAGYTWLPVPESVLGTSTDSCIASGVHFGLAGAIDRVIAEIKQARNNEQDACTVYLTGGDAERLHPFFQSQMTHEPNLVLFGLREALTRKC